MSIFETASRLKLRFSSARGALTVEDLWDIPLTSSNAMSLDHMAKLHNRALKEFEEGSFVDPAVQKTILPTLRMDILKRIIQVKITERDKSILASANKLKKQQILSIIAGKENEQLASKSIDELKALINEL